MDFEPSPEQEAIREALEALATKHAGAARAIELAAGSGQDDALGAALREGGFEGLALGDGTGPLDAALAVMQLAAAGACWPVGHQLLTIPCATGRLASGPVAVCESGDTGPVRFGAVGSTLVCVAGDAVQEVVLEADDLQVVPSRFGYPFARIEAGVPDRAVAVEGAEGSSFRGWWRVALAAEMVGNMQAALDVTVGYLREREQFGRPIGSFQAVAHRLADCAVRVEGSRWMTLEAAARHAEPQAAAWAAGHAARSAALVHRETHQLSGAIGYTLEHDLHVFSMRLQALRLELGGAPRHFREGARLRWRPGA